VHLESSKGASTTGMNDSLWNTFVIKAIDLLAAGVIFEEHWTSLVLGDDFEPVIWDSACQSKNNIHRQEH